MAIRGYGFKKINLSREEIIELVKTELIDSINLYERLLLNDDEKFLLLYSNPKEEFTNELAFYQEELKNLENCSKEELLEWLSCTHHINNDDIYQEISNLPYFWRNLGDLDFYSLEDTLQHLKEKNVPSEDLDRIIQFWKDYPDGCIVCI